MAICSTCGQRYIGTSCSETRAFAWGAEPDWQPGQPDWPCRDCGTPPGGRHHHGCCVALCALGCVNPRDLPQPDQALFCAHHTDCDPDDGDDDELPLVPLKPTPASAPLFT